MLSSCCNQIAVPGLGLVKSRLRSLGGPRIGQSLMMWCAVWTIGPHTQADVGRSPQRFILWLNLPTPVRSLFNVTQDLRGKSAPGGNAVFGVTVNWLGGAVSCHEVLHLMMRNLIAHLQRVSSYY